MLVFNKHFFLDLFSFYRIRILESYKWKHIPISLVTLTKNYTICLYWNLFLILCYFKIIIVLRCELSLAEKRFVNTIKPTTFNNNLVLHPIQNNGLSNSWLVQILFYFIFLYLKRFFIFLHSPIYVMHSYSFQLYFDH